MATNHQDEYRSRYSDLDYNFLLELATEALKRAGMYNECGHPEDLAAGLTPAIEAVALGFGAGVTWVYNNPDPKWILREAEIVRQQALRENPPGEFP